MIPARPAPKTIDRNPLNGSSRTMLGAQAIGHSVSGIAVERRLNSSWRR
jgi:hypothetical protein